MALINLNERRGKSTSGDMELLETDVYRMKITRAVIEDDQYGEPDKNGLLPVKLVLTWEVSGVTDEQDADCMGLAVWQRFNPYYGMVRDGGPSKFKAFLDGLAEQDLLPDFNPANPFDTDMLVGIEQRVNVENYAKTMGPNAGKPGNRVVGTLPLKRKAAAKAAKPEAKNVPQVVADGEVDEDADLPF